MEARAIQRTVRQSARKMRLVVDLIRGRAVPEAYAILRYSKKLAAKHIHKVLKSAVANAQQAAQRQNAAFDADGLRVKYAVVNEGPTLKRFTSAAMGRRPRFSSGRATWRSTWRRRRPPPSPRSPPPPPRRRRRSPRPRRRPRRRSRRRPPRRAARSGPRKRRRPGRPGGKRARKWARKPIPTGSGSGS